MKLHLTDCGVYFALGLYSNKGKDCVCPTDEQEDALFKQVKDISELDSAGASGYRVVISLESISHLTPARIRLAKTQIAKALNV